MSLYERLHPTRELRPAPPMLRWILKYVDQLSVTYNNDRAHGHVRGSFDIMSAFYDAFVTFHQTYNGHTPSPSQFARWWATYQKRLAPGLEDWEIEEAALGNT